MYKHILPQSCEKVNAAGKLLCKLFMMISNKQSSDLAFAKSLPIYDVWLCVYASGSVIIATLQLVISFCLYGSNVISTSCSAHIVRTVAGSPVYVISTRSPSEYPSADFPSGRAIPYPRLYSGALSSSKRIPI